MYNPPKKINNQIMVIIEETVQYAVYTQCQT